MDLENNAYNYHQFRYQTINPDYLTNKLVTEVESKVILPSTNKFDNSISLPFIWISIFAITSWILYRAVRETTIIENRNISIFPFWQTPCKNCKFYNRNLYLQCAVHPSLVLTKEAHNCIDYCNNRQEDLVNENTKQHSVSTRKIHD